MVDWLTVSVSLATSLAGSYVGVRYFTGPRMRAERAAQARLGIRDLVSPVQRDVRAFRAQMNNSLRRDHVAHPDDAVWAIKVLRLSHDLPRIPRWSVRRRVERLVGSGWSRIAELRDTTLEDDAAVHASYAMSISLLDARRHGERRSYVDGLLQRAYVAGPNSREVRQLERDLLLLSEGR